MTLGIQKTLGALLGLLIGVSTAAADVSYSYPKQPSQGTLQKADPRGTMLTDSARGADDKTTAKGKRGLRDDWALAVDWTFDKPVRITAITIGIGRSSEHTDVQKLRLYGADGQTPFLDVPDLELPVLSRPGKTIDVTVPLPGDGLVVQKLRTQFLTATSHTRVSEVVFETAPASASELSDAQVARAARQPPAMDEVVVPMPPLPPRGTKAPETIWGVCGHVMHTPVFYPPGTFGPYWQLEYTLGPLLEANLGLVREPAYQGWFANAPEKRERVMQHRGNLERYLQIYQDYGVDVMLVAMACSPGDKVNMPYREEYFDYVASLVKRFDCIKVVEMHNEPNLRFFWKGSVEDYVSTYRPLAAKVKAARPDVKVAVGSISSLWWQPGVDWFKKAIDLGVLEFADAVSVHPYNRTMPPEVDPHFTQLSRTDPQHQRHAFKALWQIVKDAAPDRHLELYLTELGYSSAREGIAGIGSEQTQADYLSRLMLLYLQVRMDGVPIEGVYWYDLKNDGTDEHFGEANFGLISYDTTRRKPAYDAYRRIAGFFNDADDFVDADLSATFSNWAEAGNAYTWRRVSDGALVVPFWRLPHLQGHDADFTATLSVQLPAGFAPEAVTLHSLDEQSPRPTPFTSNNGRLEVPVHVSDRAAWLVVSPAPAAARSERK